MIPLKMNIFLDDFTFSSLNASLLNTVFSLSPPTNVCLMGESISSQVHLVDCLFRSLSCHTRLTGLLWFPKTIDTCRQSATSIKVSPSTPNLSHFYATPPAHRIYIVMRPCCIFPSPQGLSKGPRSQGARSHGGKDPRIQQGERN